MRKMAKGVATAVNCCLLAVLILTTYIQKQLPDRYSVVAGEEITFTCPYPVQMYISKLFCLGVPAANRPLVSRWSLSRLSCFSRQREGRWSPLGRPRLSTAAQPYPVLN